MQCLQGIINLIFLLLQILWLVDDNCAITLNDQTYDFYLVV